jgi:MotA/TolQ/ExbB proton channel family
MAVPTVIDAVKRVLARSQRDTHAEMKRGLGKLATIASTAPFVGLFGTVIGIMNALYRGCGAPRAICMAAAASGISEALVSTALGLLVAVPASWSYNYFTSVLETFDIETMNSANELASNLMIQLARGGAPHRSSPKLSGRTHRRLPTRNLNAPATSPLGCLDDFAKAAKSRTQLCESALVNQRCLNQTRERTLRGQPGVRRPNCDSRASSVISCLLLAHTRWCCHQN